MFSSKRSKGADGTPAKKVQPLFRLSTTSADRAFGTTSGSKAITPTSPLFDRSTVTPASFTLPSGTSSAPAGRSPKQKRVGLLSKKRSSLSPFKRIEPPLLGARKAGHGGLPLSIDAALNGTLSKNKEPAVTQNITTAPLPAPVPTSDALTIEESLPKSWFFEIHEDTPEEEAANLMEHSTGILDISSDDEAGPSKRDHDRGKENIPPLDHDLNANAQGENVQLSTKQRLRLADPDAMKDEGDERSPLSPLPTEDFYGKGLDAKSVEIVKPDEIDSTPGAICEKTHHTTAKASITDENETPSGHDSALDNLISSAQTRDVNASPGFEIAVD